MELINGAAGVFPVALSQSSKVPQMKRLHLSLYPDGDAATSGIFHGVNLPGPNYQELVTPFGRHGERVGDPKRLAGAIKNGLASVAQGKVAILAVALSG